MALHCAIFIQSGLYMPPTRCARIALWIAPNGTSQLSQSVTQVSIERHAGVDKTFKEDICVSRELVKRLLDYFKVPCVHERVSHLT